jgi:hypothetical protein
LFMQKSRQIPCANCSLWNGNKKKFTCNPENCKVLSSWLRVYLPQVCDGNFDVGVSEAAISYIV